MNLDEKRVLVIRCGAIGDLVVSTSIIDSLRQKFGENVIIDWVATPLGKKLFKHDKRLHHVFSLQHRKVPISLSTAKRKIIKHSKRNPYDLLINLDAGNVFKKLSKAIYAKERFGRGFSDIDTEIKGDYALNSNKRVYAPAIDDKKIVKEAMPMLYGEKKELVWQRFSLPKEYIIINASNSHHKKSRINYRAWPKEQWKSLIAKLSKSVTLVIIGNRGEEKYFKEIAPFPSNVIDLVGKTSISELITVVKNAKAIVTTDTGPAHIASALKTPIYVLIGPTPHKETGPYHSPENPVTVISKHLSCAPCYKTEVMKACQDNICMREITVEMVLKAMKKVLKQ
ncbi:MAG: glycosyltransferase family 9 protein [Campylobacterota bacterium]|nr:glycosyltransferase family 9 protein [Campylobacterota bacterium]